MITATSIRISLAVDCTYDGCAEFAAPLLLQLGRPGAYDRCSVLEIPDTVTDWLDEHRTARKRAARAENQGFRFDTIRRHEHVNDLYAINTSLPERQGRRMSNGYWERPSDTPLPDYPCELHGIHTYGVLHPAGPLVAYLWIYRAGDLALVSSILGHADHLDRGIMYLLFAGALAAELEHGPGLVVYNRHDSGTDGLRFFKERLGFRERLVEWLQ